MEKGQEEFEKLSKVIRREVTRFEGYRVEDFKNSVIKYLQSLMENQQKVSFTCGLTMFLVLFELQAVVNILFNLHRYSWVRTAPVGTLIAVFSKTNWNIFMSFQKCLNHIKNFFLPKAH